MEYVYKYEHTEKGCIYIGRTNNLIHRILVHNYSDEDNIEPKYKKLLQECNVYYMKLKNKALSISCEAFLIDQYKPLLNKMLKYYRDDIGDSVKMILPKWESFDLKTFDDGQKHYCSNKCYLLGTEVEERKKSFIEFLKSIEGKRLYSDDQNFIKEEFETIGLKLRYKGINTFNGALEDTYKESYFCRFYNEDVEGKKYVDYRRVLPDGTVNKNRNKHYWILENRNGC